MKKNMKRGASTRGALLLRHHKLCSLILEVRLKIQPIEWALCQSSSCPGLSRASTFLLHPSKKDVDGRDKPGHDERRIILNGHHEELQTQQALPARLV
ncbi:MAG TPA: hypothetical protein VGD54_07400, partial [Steroidobacteraceae bacterium]